MAIRSFSDKATKFFFFTGRVKPTIGWAPVCKIVKKRLDMLHYATALDDLRSPPGNRLKALRGNMRGYHSVRVNDQWHVVFRWTPAGPTMVHVADYH